ncbi:MAG TPA: hypothetical protein VKR30_01035 [Candidatus Limnocylindrales bacterium]|nr:hypothetical protein [Candidatus Limnocylindrales bacterium]
MQFNDRLLRTAIRSQSAAIAAVVAERGRPTDAEVRRSLQRPILLAALREHFGAKCQTGVLLSSFDRRRDRTKRREKSATELAHGRRMAERYLAYEDRSDQPLEVLVPARERQVLGHDLKLGYDLVYQDSDGLRVRQLLSDGEVRQGEHLRLYAVAVAIHFEATGRSLAQVDVWQLRDGHRYSWPRAMLLRLAPTLQPRLDAVERGLGLDAA